MRFLPFVGVVVVAAFLSAGCEDPCKVLADRICNCQPNSTAQTSCRTDRIVNQQSTIQITDADRAFCSQKLDTCTCDAIDENKLDACGFVPEDAGTTP